MCASCVSHVKKAVESVKGVELVEVNLLTETMNVIFDENVTNDEVIIQANPLAIEVDAVKNDLLKKINFFLLELHNMLHKMLSLCILMWT